MIDVIRACSKAPRPTRVTRSAAASKGKKTGEGPMMCPLEAKPNQLVVADPREAQTLTPAATTQALHILTRTDCTCRSLRVRCALRHATAESAVNIDIELISLCVTMLHAADRAYACKRYHLPPRHVNIIYEISQDPPRVDNPSFAVSQGRGAWTESRHSWCLLTFFMMRSISAGSPPIWHR
jgi:hypothetical protein